MNHIDRILLLHKRLTGRMTESDQRALDHLMKSGDKQLKENEIINKVWELSGKYPKHFQPDVDKAWSGFKSKMDQQAQPQKRPVFQMWIGRAAAAMLLLVSAWFGWQFFQNETVIYTTYTTTTGEQYELSLPDGSLIVLGEESMIRYPETFDGETRTIELSGMAFFDVESDTEHPFIINANIGQVEVLGTSFLVRSYSSEARDEVLVKSGRVAYTPTGQEPMYLMPGNKMIYQAVDESPELLENDSFNDLAWMTGEIQFSKTPLSEVLNTLEHNFDVSFSKENMTEILDCTLSLRFEGHKEYDEILAAISIAFDAELEETSPKVYALTNGRCQ